MSEHAKETKEAKRFIEGKYGAGVPLAIIVDDVLNKWGRGKSFTLKMVEVINERNKAVLAAEVQPQPKKDEVQE